ncbi:hypothetical protein [Candidatus Wolbachia massiliensis]|uniref:Uncharacterized protein n=1 Tax=Candidatus Wolbachia massiliensis TaxID=1845000 RepID=A0A7L7YRA2_9RICK|nr:hypothetical protein [Candidatus Wolbachia massiliensis]QOD38197.1 hypothetical protein ID128_05385 [Candidatus Wolbachia massiliensis]
MADSGISITFNPKISHNLTRLSEITKEPVQELIERLIVEGIECEVDEIAFTDIVKECTAPGAETIKYEDFKQG